MVNFSLFLSSIIVVYILCKKAYTAGYLRGTKDQQAAGASFTYDLITELGISHAQFKELANTVTTRRLQQTTEE